MLSKPGIIELLRSETGISGVTKLKRSLYGGGIWEAECKQILNHHTLFVILDISIQRKLKGSDL